MLGALHCLRLAELPGSSAGSLRQSLAGSGPNSTSRTPKMPRAGLTGNGSWRRSHKVINAAQSQHESRTNRSRSACGADDPFRGFHRTESPWECEYAHPVSGYLLHSSKTISLFSGPTGGHGKSGSHHSRGSGLAPANAFGTG